MCCFIIPRIAQSSSFSLRSYYLRLSIICHILLFFYCVSGGLVFWAICSAFFLLSLRGLRFSACSSDSFCSMFAVPAPGFSVVQLDLWLNSLYIDNPYLRFNRMSHWSTVRSSLSVWLPNLVAAVSLFNFYAPNNWRKKQLRFILCICLKKSPSDR